MPAAPGHSVERGRRSLALAVLVVLVATGGVWVTWKVSTATATGRRIDSLAVSPLAAGAWGDLTVWSHLLAPLSSRFVLGGLVVAVLIAAVQRRWLDGGLAVLLVGGANLAGRLLKHYLLGGVLLADGTFYGSGSPSGHTIAAGSLAAALLLVAPPVARPAVAVLAGTATAGVGVANVVVGAHRPSDVLAGVLVVLASFAVAAAAREILAPAARGRVRSLGARTVVAALAGLGLTGLAVATWLTISVAGLTGGDAGPQRAAFGASVVAVTAVSAIAFAVMLALGEAHRDRPGRVRRMVSGPVSAHPAH